MKEVRISDAELQKIIGWALRAWLRGRGFTMGASDAGLPPSYWFVINLDLAGDVSVVRGEDGVWTFQQQPYVIADRLAATFEEHSAAQASQWGPRCR